MRQARRRRTGLRCLPGLIAGLALVLRPVPSACAGDWEKMRDSFDEKLRPYAGRLAEIEAREHGDPADPVQRAEKMTRDRIARLSAVLNRGSKVRSVAEAAQMGSGEPAALADASREQDEQLDRALRDWGAAGPERRKLREAFTAAQRNVERAGASMAQAIEDADETRTQVAESRVSEAVGRLEAEAAELGERLKARWQREYAAREREQLHRERAAAERERAGGW
jgi:hypothetical protein